MTNMQAEKMVSYWAIPVSRSKTMIFNTLAAIAPMIDIVSQIIGLPEFKALIPLKYLPYYSLAVVTVNLYLRKKTVRPVAFIGHGDTQEIRVPKIGPPEPAAVTD
jgi:hypothetical protein